MPNQQVMTNEEKRCLDLAKSFINEARDRMGLSRSLYAENTMIGELAAQKFTQCMQNAAKPAHPQPKR